MDRKNSATRNANGNGTTGFILVRVGGGLRLRTFFRTPQQIWNADALNVSQGGITFVCSERISPETRVTITVHVPNAPPETLTAKIVYNGEYRGGWAHSAEFRSAPRINLLTRISALTVKRSGNIPKTKFRCPACGSRRKQRCEGELFLQQVCECSHCGVHYRVVGSPTHTCLDELDPRSRGTVAASRETRQHSFTTGIDPWTRTDAVRTGFTGNGVSAI